MARVLVIDDDPVARCAMAIFLEDAGHEVREASDGIEGLDAFRKARADVVVTDVLMPGMDGLEMIMALWRDYPEHQGHRDQCGRHNYSDGHVPGSCANLRRVADVHETSGP